ncbi:MAG: non-hydrolyzing UDP-N-acetylglucosamine 2-epimerase [Balneolaceae bacterium]
MAKQIFILFGTRPEAIKLAPVIKLLQAERIPHTVIHTGQHDSLANDILDYFDISPDLNLAVMEKSQSLNTLLTALYSTLAPHLEGRKGDLMLVQGDTLSAFAGAHLAHLNGLTVAHLEAGLRSHDRLHPFPEETNRRLLSHIADLHFAPTASAKRNLLAENIPDEQIQITGNTVIDALQLILEKEGHTGRELRKQYAPDNARVMMLTTHRRENIGEPQLRIFKAVRELADRFDDLHVLFPIHPNPAIRPHLELLLTHNRIHLLDPIPYTSFIPLLAECDLVLTDSGGIQEEAPALGVPVFVAREKTERPELIESGVGFLTGTDTETITHMISELLIHAPHFSREELFGDGQAAPRVVRTLAQNL